MKTIQLCKLSLAGLLLVVSQGCAGDDLTRKAAEDLISQAPMFASQHTTLDTMTRDRFQEGIRLGVWDEKGNISIETKEYLREASAQRLVLIDPYELDFEVTGIADIPGADGSIKLIEFEWSYNELPSIAKYFIGGGGSGSAIVTKYDDGWRFTEIDAIRQNKINDIGADLLPHEEESVDGVLSSIRERLAREEQERRALIESSKEPTRTLGVFTHYERRSLEPLRLTVTDAGIESSDGKRAWYGGIRSVVRKNTYAGPRLFQQRVGLEVDVPHGEDLHFVFEGKDDSIPACQAIENGFNAWRAKYESLMSEDWFRYVNCRED